MKMDYRKALRLHTICILVFSFLTILILLLQWTWLFIPVVILFLIVMAIASKYWVCPACGKGLGRGKPRFCPHCGEKLEWEEKGD